MADKKGMNPIAIGIGIAVGAVGAFLLSKKENRAKVAKAVKNIKTDKGQGLLSSIGAVVNDVSHLSTQKDLDKSKRSKRSK